MKRAVVTAAVSVASLVAVARLRQSHRRWGATDGEVHAALPGDALIGGAGLAATRAITIAASPEDVWPWLAQLGQERAGFYSYVGVENLAGCDIGDVDRIVPEWQHIEVGDTVKLHPAVALRVAIVEPGRALVLEGAAPEGEAAAPYDFTWAFVLRPCEGGATRLVVRERYGYTQRWSALVVEPLALASFVMSRKMLRTIRDRAERQARLISG